MPKQLNKESILAMKRQGFTNKQIAQRNNCSVRQVVRLTKGMERGKFIDSETESMMRGIMSKFLPDSKVALSFGISRQAINASKEL